MIQHSLQKGLVFVCLLLSVGMSGFKVFAMVQVTLSSRQAEGSRKPFLKLAMIPGMMNLKYVSM